MSTLALHYAFVIQVHGCVPAGRLKERPAASIDQQISMVHRPSMQCKKVTKRFGHARTTSPIMRFWPSSMPMGGRNPSYRADSSQPCQIGIKIADVNAVSSSRTYIDPVSYLFSETTMDPETRNRGAATPACEFRCLG